MSDFKLNDMSSCGTRNSQSSVPDSQRTLPHREYSDFSSLESLKNARDGREAATPTATSGKQDNSGTLNMVEVPLFSYESGEDEAENLDVEADASSDVDSWDMLPSKEQNPRVQDTQRDWYQSFPEFVQSPVETDDWDDVSVPDENEAPEPEEQPHRDFEIPDVEGRFHETYRFEVENPGAASYIRVLHGLGHARRTGRLGRALPRHALSLATSTAIDVAVASRPIIQGLAQASVATYHSVSNTVAETVAPAVVDAVNLGRERLPILIADAHFQGQELRERLAEGFIPWLELGVEYATSAANRPRPERRDAW